MDYLSAYTTWLTKQNMDHKTIREYLHAVAVYSTWFQWETGQQFHPTVLDGRHLHSFGSDPAPYGFKGRKTERPAPATRNKIIAGLRVLCRWAREAGYVPEDLGGNLEFVIGAPKEPRALEPDEERRLIRYLNEQVKVAELARSTEKLVLAHRNRAMVGAGLFVGLRAEETVTLTWEQLILRAGAAEVKDVVGKYGFVRSIPIPNVARRWCLGYKELLLKAGEYRADGPVYVSQKGNGAVTTRGLQYVMTELATGLQLPDLTHHVLRHTYGSNLVAAGIPLPTVARLMGHIKRNGEPNIATTARYTLPRASELRQAVGVLDFDDGGSPTEILE